jgi:putative sugar O-methyltransferase
MLQMSTLKAWVVAIQQEAQARGAVGGPIWQRFTNVASYLWDLSPDSLLRIRLHTEVFTGEFKTDLLGAMARIDGSNFARQSGYTYYTEDIPEEFWLSEPEVAGIGQLGPNFEGRIINGEIARYQGYISNFYLAGMFDTGPGVVLEIGAGYGAIGHHLLRLARGRTTYVIVDLPLGLLTVGAYILTNMPDARIAAYDPATPQFWTDESLREYDVVLVPHYRLDTLQGVRRIDWAVNTISMAEMEPETINGYLDFLAARLQNGFFFQNYEWREDGGSLRALLAARLEVVPHVDYWQRGTGSVTSLTFWATGSAEARDRLLGREMRVLSLQRGFERVILGAPQLPEPVAEPVLLPEAKPINTIQQILEGCRARAPSNARRMVRVARRILRAMRSN